MLGSQGSVLPLFEEQIARGVPLTVTHPDAERYFMTMEQATAALLAALEFPLTPAIVVPGLGQPVRILDLATACSKHNAAVRRSSSPASALAKR